MFVCCLFFQSCWLWPATHSVNCWHHLLFDGGDLNSHEFVLFSLHRRLWKSFPLTSLKRRINEFTWRSSESRRFFSVGNNRLPQELEDFFNLGRGEVGKLVKSTEEMQRPMSGFLRLQTEKKVLSWLPRHISLPQSTSYRLKRRQQTSLQFHPSTFSLVC